MSLSPRAVRALKRYCGTVLLLACGCADDEPERSRPNPGQGSQAITYWQDVVPIFERHCMACHQEGGIGTFRLDDYAQAKAYAALIRHATSARSHRADTVAFPTLRVTSEYRARRAPRVAPPSRRKRPKACGGGRAGTRCCSRTRTSSGWPRTQSAWKAQGIAWSRRPGAPSRRRAPALHRAR